MRMASKRYFGGGFGGEQLGHARFQIAALAAIALLAGGINQQPRGFDVRGHVGQLVLDGLVFGDRLAESGAALRVADGFFKSGARNAQTAGGDVQALGFQSGHHLLETLALDASDQILRRHGEIGEMQLAGFDAFVSQLVDVAAHRHAGCALLDHESAHAAMSRLRAGIGLGEQQKRVAVPRVGDPHLRAIDAIHVAIARGRGADVLQIRAGVGFGEADAAALFAGRHAGQEAPLLLLRSEVAPPRRTSRSCFRSRPPSPSQPREISSKIMANVVVSTPAPPYSSGMFRPNSPISFIWATSACGYSSRCSMAEATGITSFSTNCRTVRRISCCSSVSMVTLVLLVGTRVSAVFR